MSPANQSTSKVHRTSDTHSSNFLRFISLRVIAKNSPYSQDYLSLQARKGLLKARKLGRNWSTTNEWLEEYIQKHASKEEAKDYLKILQNSHSNDEFYKKFDAIIAKAGSIVESIKVQIHSHFKKFHRALHIITPKRVMASMVVVAFFASGAFVFAAPSHADNLNKMLVSTATSVTISVVRGAEEFWSDLHPFNVKVVYESFTETPLLIKKEWFALIDSFAHTQLAFFNKAVSIVLAPQTVITNARGQIAGTKTGYLSLLFKNQLRNANTLIEENIGQFVSNSFIDTGKAGRQFAFKAYKSFQAVTPKVLAFIVGGRAESGVEEALGIDSRAQRQADTGILELPGIIARLPNIAPTKASSLDSDVPSSLDQTTGDTSQSSVGSSSGTVKTSKPKLQESLSGLGSMLQAGSGGILQGLASVVFENDLTVKGDTHLAKTTITGGLVVSSNGLQAATTDSSEGEGFHSAFAGTGSSVSGYDLTVLGQSLLQGSTRFGSDVIVNGAFNANSSATIAGSLVVGGTLSAGTFSPQQVVATGLVSGSSVSGQSGSFSNLSTNQFSISGDSAIGNTTNNTLTIKSATTFSGPVTFNSTVGGSGFTVSGGSTFSTLTVSGATVLQSTVAITGTTTLRSALVFGSLSSDPTTAAAGTVYYDTTTSALRAYTGGAWNPLGGGFTKSGTLVTLATVSDQVAIGTSTVYGLSQLTIGATSTAAIPLTLKGVSNQTANLFQVLNSGNTGLFTITSAGNVGFGTTGPSQLLSVAGSAYITSTTTLGAAIVIGSLNADPSSALNGTVYYDTTTSALRAYTGGAWNPLGGGFTKSGTLVTLATLADQVAIGTTTAISPAVVSISATSSTAVGLIVGGTTGQTAHILRVRNDIGTTLFSVGTSTSTVAGILEVTTTATSTYANGIQLASGCFRLADGNCAGTAVTGNQGQIPFYAATGNVQSATSTIFIATNSGGVTGNVGIGTTTPRSILQVAGLRAQFTLTDTNGTLDNKHWYFASQNGNLFIGTSTDSLTSTSTYLTINNNGNVGIGTTNPLGQFQVGSSAFIVQGNNVGIGTTTPAKSFSVVGDVFLDSKVITVSTSSASSLTFVYQRSSTTTIPQVIHAWSISTTTAVGNPSILSIDGANGRVGVGTTSPIGQLSIEMAGTNPYALWISSRGTSTPALVVTGAGSLGIGTSSPAKALSVAGDAYLDSQLISFSSSSASSFTMAFNRSATTTIPQVIHAWSISTTTAAGNPSILSIDGANGRVGVGTTSPIGQLSIEMAGTNPYALWISSRGTSTPALVVTGAGSLGIGTSSPAALLGLNGNAYLNSNLITIASSSASVITIAFQASATTTVASSQPYAFTIATSTTATPIIVFSTNGGKATTTINGGFTVDSGALEYDFTSRVTSIDNLSLGSMQFDTDAGIVNWVDLGVTTASANNTVESYSAQIDGNALLTLYALSDGTGTIQGNPRVGISTSTPWGTLSVEVGTSTIPAFVIGDIGTTTPLFIVTNFGNVGLATATPSMLLSVGGNVYLDSNTITIASSSAAFVTVAYQRSATTTIPQVINGFAFSTSTNANAVPIFSMNGVNGNIGIGTSSPSGQLAIEIGNNPFPVWIGDTATSSAATSSAFVITGTGNVGLGISNPIAQLQLSTQEAVKAAGTTWANPSDRRLKENIVSFTDGLSALMGIRPVRYTLNGKAGLPKGLTDIGIIAQEVKEYAPYTVSTYKARLEPTDKEDTELYKFNASALTFVLINGVKELNVKAEAIKHGDVPLDKLSIVGNPEGDLLYVTSGAGTSSEPVFKIAGSGKIVVRDDITFAPKTSYIPLNGPDSVAIVQPSASLRSVRPELATQLVVVSDKDGIRIYNGSSHEIIKEYTYGNNILGDIRAAHDLVSGDDSVYMTTIVASGASQRMKLDLFKLALNQVSGSTEMQEQGMNISAQVVNGGVKVNDPRTQETRFFMPGLFTQGIDATSIMGQWGYEDKKDNAGKGSDLSMSGSVGLVPEGIRGKAASFDSTSYFTARVESTEQDMSDITFGTWFKPRSLASGQSLIAKDGAFSLVVSDQGRLLASVAGSDGTVVTRQSSWTADTNWHHVVVVVSALKRKLTMYVDGAVVNDTLNGEISFSGIRWNRSSVKIGQGYYGMLDDTFVAGSEYTSETIQSMYLVGSKARGHGFADTSGLQGRALAASANNNILAASVGSNIVIIDLSSDSVLDRITPKESIHSLAVGQSGLQVVAGVTSNSVWIKTQGVSVRSALDELYQERNSSPILGSRDQKEQLSVFEDLTITGSRIMPESGSGLPVFAITGQGAVEGLAFKDTSFTNEVVNGSFEYWQTDTSPYGWNGTITQSKESKFGNSSVSLSANSVSTSIKNAKDFASSTITTSAWIKSSSNNDARVSVVFDEGKVTQSSIDSVYHSGSGQWERLIAKGNVPVGVSTIKVRVLAQTGKALVDGVMTQRGLLPTAYVAHSFDTLLEHPQYMVFSAQSHLGTSTDSMAIARIPRGTFKKGIIIDQLTASYTGSGKAQFTVKNGSDELTCTIAGNKTACADNGSLEVSSDSDLELRASSSLTGEGASVTLRYYPLSN